MFKPAIEYRDYKIMKVYVNFIKIFICKNVSSIYASAQGIPDLISNRSPVLLTLSDSILKKHINRPITNKYTDCNSYRDYLSQEINLRIMLKTAMDLEAANDSFINLIKRAAVSATPQQRTPTLPNNLLDPESVRLLVNQRGQVRKKWQRTRHPHGKYIFNKLSKDTSQLIKSINGNTIKDYVTNLSPTEDKDITHFGRPQKASSNLLSTPTRSDQ